LTRFVLNDLIRVVFGAFDEFFKHPYSLGRIHKGVRLELLGGVFVCEHSPPLLVSPDEDWLPAVAGSPGTVEGAVSDEQPVRVVTTTAKRAAAQLALRTDRR
jgi:hypothetical protein